MPDISTHINFLRILKNKYFNELDINFLTLGSIAPNYYVIFNDTNKSCLSHFKEDSSEKCNSWLFMVIRTYLLWEERFMVKSVIYGYSWLFMVNSRRL